MRIHLDVVGGLAGDMFAAAVIDALPEHAEGLLETLRSLELPAGLSVRFAQDRADGIQGRRFLVSLPDDSAHRAVTTAAVHAHHPHRHEGSHAPHGHASHEHRTEVPAHDDGHRPYQDIRQWLDESALTDRVKRHAHGLFATLASAEAQVHGIAVDAVQFHEVGAWDSIVDFVAAAWLIDALDDFRWSWSPLPLGSGTVRCAHGLLPVPAPAAALLLQGMPVLDDGIAGERVTPTGAAILKYLQARQAPPGGHARRLEVITSTGVGHGTRTLVGAPNIVRCMVLADGATAHAPAHEEVTSIQFEVDDQSPEDLAVAIDHLRQAAGVLEVYQAPLYGKKGRIAVQLQLLLHSDAADRIVAMCFEETTTLGLRVTRVMRRTLERQAVTVGTTEPVPVKLALRPCGEMTAKAEMDAVAGHSGHAAREQARAAAQNRALAGGAT